jgi:hypothetical protein
LLVDLIKTAIEDILLSSEYQNEYGAICITHKGEKVKSKAKKNIADYLYTNDFQYENEKPALTRVLWIFNEEISHPDFYLTDFGVYKNFVQNLPFKN